MSLLVGHDSLRQTLDFESLCLRDLFRMSNNDVRSSLVGLNLLKNGMSCDKCEKKMRVVKRSDSQDGIQWICTSKGVYCSKKSIRAGSFFANSNLPLSILLVLCYMFAVDYDNRHICRELNLDMHTVVDLLYMCREVCENYCNNAPAVGGTGKIVEIDESCISKRKYNRGKRMPGNQQWILGGVERGSNGKAFAFRVPDRKKRTLLKIIKKRIKQGTTIISDDWPAYRKLGKRMGKPVGYKHYVICHKKIFARTDRDQQNNILRVHTNKVEGFWSHVKHKIKRIRGTSEPLKSSYNADAVFRQNCDAENNNILELFFGRISMIYRIDNYEL